MKVLIYSTSPNGAGKKLQQIIEPLISNQQKEIYKSIEELSQRFRQPLGDKCIGVFLASHQQDLSDLLSIRDLFRDLRIILVLPDREENTTTKGHALRPRFLSYADGDLTDVAAVMSKMLGNPYSQMKQWQH